MGREQWFANFNVTSVRFSPSDADWVDLIPLFYGGYALRLEALEWPQRDNEILDNLALSDAGDSDQVVVERAWYEGDCGQSLPAE